MNPRAKLARSVMERAVHLHVKAVKLDRIEELSEVDRTRAETKAQESELRAQARNLITIAREQLTALEELCRD